VAQQFIEAVNNAMEQQYQQRQQQQQKKKKQKVAEETMPHNWSVILFVGGTEAREDLQNFRNNGGTIVIATPGRYIKSLMGNGSVQTMMN